MRKSLSFFRKSGEGFTLVELLVVVAIIGILTAVAVPSLLKLVGIGNVPAANAELATVQLAVDAYMVENQSIPLAGADLSLYMRGDWAKVKSNGSYTWDTGTVFGGGDWKGGIGVTWGTTSWIKK